MKSETEALEEGATSKVGGTAMMPFDGDNVIPIRRPRKMPASEGLLVDVLEALPRWFQDQADHCEDWDDVAYVWGADGAAVSKAVACLMPFVNSKKQVDYSNSARVQLIEALHSMVVQRLDGDDLTYETDDLVKAYEKSLGVQPWD